LDRISHRVQRQGRQIDLSPKEFCLLQLLMRHAGQPMSRSAKWMCISTICVGRWMLDLSYR
jgi:hypothetical protein